MKITDEKLDEMLKDDRVRSKYKTFEFHKRTQTAEEKRSPVFRRLAVIAVAALLAVVFVTIGIVTAAKTANQGVPIPLEITETIPVPATEKDTETTDMIDTKSEPANSETESDLTDAQTEPDENTTEGDITDIQTNPSDETTEPITHTDTEDITVDTGAHTVTNEVTTAVNGSKVPTDADYSLVGIDEMKYIVFENVSEYEREGQESATLNFKSMKEFVECVLEGKLEDWQKIIVASTFPKDENGIVICDFDNLFIPILPSDEAIYEVYWNGESYSFSFTLKNSVFGNMYYYTQEQYNNAYKNDYENFFNNDAITVDRTEQTEDGKTEIYYSTKAGELKQVRYLLTDDDKTIVVDKTYRLNMNNPLLDNSAEYPSNVTLYCIENNEYYVVDLFEFSEEPSDLWLLSFEIEKYVD